MIPKSEQTDRIWSCPLMRALEQTNPPPFIKADGRWFEFKIKDHIPRYELAKNQKRRE